MHPQVPAACTSQVTVPAQPPPHVKPPQSLLDHYVVESFTCPPTNPPLMSATSSSSNPPSRACSALPVGYHGGHLLSSSSAGHSSPVSSPSSTFCHGGSNLSDYTASKWGASLVDVTLSWLANTACSSHHLSSSSIPPSRTGFDLIWSPPASNDHGSSTAVASRSHHEGCPHSSAWQPNLEGYDDYFFTNYGGLTWWKGGLFLAIGGLDCLSGQDSVLMEIVILTAMGSFRGGFLSSSGCLPLCLPMQWCSGCS